MQTTYTIASAQGNMEVIMSHVNADGSKGASKAVAYKDGSYKCFRLGRNGKWANISRGNMAAKRFGWWMDRAKEALAN